MQILIVDDDISSRKILQKYLSSYGDCDIAVDGKEALRIFENALKRNESYDLVCLDIMMPEVDGQEALKEIRRIEAEKGILGLDCAKVIMTTALSDFSNIKIAFRAQCEAYLIKPIEKQKLVKTLKELNCIK